MRGDAAEAAELEKQMEELDRVIVDQAAMNGSGVETQDVLTMVNERNRKANLEAVRKAEAETADKKRKERKARFLAAQAQRLEGLKPGTPGTQKHGETGYVVFSSVERIADQRTCYGFTLIEHPFPAALLFSVQLTRLRGLYRLCLLAGRARLQRNPGSNQ